MTALVQRASRPRTSPRWVMSLRLRRLAAAAVTVVATGLFWLVHQRIGSGLGHGSVYSGATLLSSVLLLALIGVRKRLVMLPLWSLSCWLQIHIYTGLFACAVFLLHVPRIIASGWFEGGLSWLFLVVSISGFYGLVASRLIPKRLTAMSVQPRYDRIAWHRQQFSLLAGDVYDQLDGGSDARVLSEFYARVLQPFFAGAMTRGFLLRPSLARRRHLLAELGDLRRYLSGDTLAAADRLAALVRQRDELDYHHALQFRLRAWVAVHAALSCVLVVWSLVHAALAITMLGH